MANFLFSNKLLLFLNRNLKLMTVMMEIVGADESNLYLEDRETELRHAQDEKR